jgi:hypothetical protein
MRHISKQQQDAKDMAGTRSSQRLNSSSPQATKDSAGIKRKAEDASPSSNKAKRGRPSREQKTLEETMLTGDAEEDNKVESAQSEQTNDVSAESKHP